MDNEFKDTLRGMLLELPYSKKINSKQIAVRCILCRDSKKHHDSAHMYIKIDTLSDDPILFNCFKCNVGGVLTPSMLKEFDIRDLSLSSNLLKYNNASMKKINRKMGVNDNNIKLKIPVYTTGIDEKINFKKEYIENRLGLSLSYEELYRLKVVFNLSDFLRLNQLEATIKQYKIELLSKDYVGFVSCRNEFIIFRNTIDNSNKRYDKYSVFQTIENTRQFYSIPNEIDLLSADQIELTMAEGVFDILGIYYHLKNEDKKNKIYVAICGSGFANVIKYFIQLGIFGKNVVLNIYSDSDKDITYYKNIQTRLGVWFNRINIFYNRIGKDYGVKKENIELVKR